MSSTKVGELILDPFNGSGTTGIAALMNDRRFIGIEKEQEFLDISVKRYEQMKLEAK